MRRYCEPSRRCYLFRVVRPIFRCDVFEVVVVLFIGFVQLRVVLLDVECGDFIVTIPDGFAVGDETVQRVGLGIRFTIFELDLEVRF